MEKINTWLLLAENKSGIRLIHYKSPPLQIPPLQNRKFFQSNIWSNLKSKRDKKIGQTSILIGIYNIKFPILTIFVRNMLEIWNEFWISCQISSIFLENLGRFCKFFEQEQKKKQTIWRFHLWVGGYFQFDGNFLQIPPLRNLKKWPKGGGICSEFIGLIGMWTL